ncbi:methyltransferase family protein [Acetobacter sp.]|uniref:methyltransferase family protein n=1 Tax=Acetobacter sp. TaxID=440 RepID=UPI0025BA24DD|nr:isoprenylcysteine carboxylmethyltransferase family protein [Acetobacter sp.]MCH4091674.1 isoprenylcysteine carboxylmethyltransferase family protein [Acetobacter sp.]MCI1300908.1 isoprenylcysteine carboxylmethyltransferase family protein [Acetobacter sp.]MCI1316215.1 isoprenylcysteine carboxylmethyltransferase family protein [Acetobacter sp.]
MTSVTPLIERSEKFLLLAVGCYFIFANFTPVFVTHNFVACLYMAEALLDITFTVIRQPGSVSPHWRDWLVAVLGTYASLLVVATPHVAPLLPRVLCGGLALAGILLSLSAKLCLRRSFGIIAASRGLKTNGPYRIIRHPMYAGYLLMQAAFLLQYPTFHNTAVLLFTWWMQLMRIKAEEKMLETSEWVDWSQEVKWKLIPFLF